MKTLKRYLRIAFAAVLACALLPQVARADEKKVLLDYRPQEHAVADRTVHFNVNKLDRDTREFVVGAHLQILDKESGAVVADWISDGSTQQTARELDIDHPYVLHEVSAPDGYALADDVEFVLRSVKFETKGEVVSGATTADGQLNAEFASISGSEENQAFQISLFDQRVSGEQTVYKNRENPSPTTPDEKSGTRAAGRLSQTSDPTNYTPAIIIAIIGVVVVIAAIVIRRRNKR